MQLEHQNREWLQGKKPNFFFGEKAMMGGENETNFSEVNKKILNINATWRLELCIIAKMKTKNENKIK